MLGAREQDATKERELRTEDVGPSCFDSFAKCILSALRRQAATWGKN